MKTFLTKITPAVILLFSGITVAQTETKINNKPQLPKVFQHPGIAHSEDDFTFVKQQIKEKKEPWISSWGKLQQSAYASLDWNPQPFANVERGPYNNPDIGASEFRADGLAAYTHALCWAISGNQEYAKKSTEIINAWSANLKTIKNHDAALLVGMEIPHFCIAAEIVKHTSDVWETEQQIQFATMLRDICYPIIKGYYPSANGNWDASMMQATISMAIFLDDQDMFDNVVTYYLEGKGNGAIGNYFKPSGQCQESGRDQNHTQMGIRFLANTCETAWIQKTDLYGALDNRLLKGFEYTAKYNLGHDVPYEPYKSFEGRYHYKKLSSRGRGSLQSMYERVYNHYYNRKGIDAPYTKAALLKNRTKASSSKVFSDPRKLRRRIQSYIDTLMYAKK